MNVRHAIIFISTLDYKSSLILQRAIREPYHEILERITKNQQIGPSPSQLDFKLPQTLGRPTLTSFLALYNNHKQNSLATTQAAEDAS